MTNTEVRQRLTNDMLPEEIIDDDRKVRLRERALESGGRAVSFSVVPPGLPFRKLLALTGLLFLLGMGAAEVFFRHLFFEPSLRDTRDLWALHRSQLDRADTSKQVVTVGASRVQTGFCPEVFQARFPKAEMVGLHIDGSSFVPVLHDVAANTKFRGTLLCSFHSVLLDAAPGNAAEFSGKQYE